MYNWSVDEEKFKKEIREAISFLSRSRWVIGGNIYIRKQETNLFNESPITISVRFRKDIPKHEYVSFGFVLDEKVASTVSVVDQAKDKDYLKNLYLVGKF